MKCAMKYVVICSLLTGFIIVLIEGKIFTKCGLKDELIKRNFPRSYIGHWVCLIESESGKDTSMELDKPNGSKNLGIFQINSKGWCTYGKTGGKCSMKCEDLLNENLVDDSACAKKVYNELGFQAWDGWKRNCKGRNLPIPC